MTALESIFYKLSARLSDAENEIIVTKKLRDTAEMFLRLNKIMFERTRSLSVHASL